MEFIVFLLAFVAALLVLIQPLMRRRMLGKKKNVCESKGCTTASCGDCHLGKESELVKYVQTRYEQKDR